MGDPIIILFVVGLVVYSVTLHELGHAFVATWCGDPTPGKHGRLTFNPLVQLHPVYSVIMPLFCYFMFRFPFGFAFCPVDPSRFRRPLRDRALTAIAGPTMNFLVAIICVGLLWLPTLLTSDLEDPTYFEIIIFLVAFWNLVLGVFNLLPFPGLDGYEVARPALPLGIRNWLDEFRRSGFLPLILAVVVGSRLLWAVFPYVFYYFRMLLPTRINPSEMLNLWMGS